MKRTLTVIFFAILCISNGFTQESTDIVIGQRANGSDIKVKAIHFKKNIKGFSITPDFRYLCLEFVDFNLINGNWNDNGKLAIYDYNNNQLLWKMPIDYSGGNEILTNKGILIAEGTKRHYYDITTGKQLWNQTCVSGVITNNDKDSSEILLGYKSLGSGVFYALDMMNGHELWNTKIYHNMSFGGYKKINQEKYLIIGDKMHLVNPQTGILSTYDLHAGMIDKTNSITSPDDNSMLMVGTVGNEIYSMPYMTNSNVITGLNSNICIKDSCIYIADNTRLTCLDLSLNTKWEHSYPEGMASHSILTIYRNKISMLNMGHGLHSNGTKVECGIPFLASADRKTGKNFTIHYLASDKGIINDAVVYNNQYFIILNNQVASLSSSDTTSICPKWDFKKHGAPTALLSDTLYSYNQSTGNFAIICNDDYNCPVYSSDNYIYMIDKDININGRHLIYDTYNPIADIKDYVLISNGGTDNWIIKKSGVPVVHLSMMIKKCYANGNRLVLLNNNNDLCSLNIDEILKN